MASGPSPLLVIRDNLPSHLAELRDERQKLVARLVELNAAISVAETHLAVSPAPEPEERKSK